MVEFKNISDVGNTLKTFLLNNISEVTAATDVIFDSPAQIAAGPDPILSIFLYRLSRNPHLRNMPPVRTGINTAVNAPLPLDLEFLITPITNNYDDRYTILEKIAGLFHDTSVLKDDNLVGALADNENTELKIVPNELSVQEVNQIWHSSQSNPYQPGLAFLVSPVYIPSTKTEEFTRVIQRNIEFVARYTDMSPDI